jgi:hypothetical protein
MGFLEDWDLTYDEVNELLTDNPSLRSFVMGYAAEVKCKRMFFEDHPGITNLTKYDDHDRAKKGDIAFDYQGYTFTVEVKSIQSGSLVPKKRSGRVEPNFQCDGSDRRVVTFPDGSSLETTCLLVGQFDMLAVNLHAFYSKWVFVFADNADLPTLRTNKDAHLRYTDYQMDNLLKSTMPMSNPPVAPYENEPWSILDRLVERRQRSGIPTNDVLMDETGRSGIDALDNVLDIERGDIATTEPRAD